MPTPSSLASFRSRAMHSSTTSEQPCRAGNNHELPSGFATNQSTSHDNIPLISRLRLFRQGCGH
eukprot:6431429-Amphidinium_carterae.1